MRYETFGSKLRRMGAARGLTTKRLANLAGVTPSYLTQKSNFVDFGMPVA